MKTPRAGGRWAQKQRDHTEAPPAQYTKWLNPKHTATEEEMQQVLDELDIVIESSKHSDKLRRVYQDTYNAIMLRVKKRRKKVVPAFLAERPKKKISQGRAVLNRIRQNILRGGARCM